jgi:hypothetical protein
MFKRFNIAVLLLACGTVQAHYLWIERDAKGPARGYYGEWDNSLIEKSGGNLDKVINLKAFHSDPSKTLAVTRESDHLAFAVAGSADLRLTGVLFNEARNTRSTYFARSGRKDLKPVFDLELVPVSTDGNALTLMWHGAPLPKAEVTVYGPPKWKRVLTSDDQGQVTISTPWAGRYIVEAIHLDDKANAAAVQERDVATLSFEVSRGIKWDAK